MIAATRAGEETSNGNKSDINNDIKNDQQFRAILTQLNAADQREVGALFVDSVINLSDDERVKRAILTAHDKDASADALLSVFKAAKRAMIDSRPRTHTDSDWQAQASHFVAKAATAVVAPEGQCTAADPLWQTVQCSRMARNCALIFADDDTINPEIAHQYHILSKFLNK